MSEQVFGKACLDPNNYDTIEQLNVDVQNRLNSSIEQSVALANSLEDTIKIQRQLIINTMLDNTNDFQVFTKALEDEYSDLFMQNPQLFLGMIETYHKLCMNIQNTNQNVMDSLTKQITDFIVTENKNHVESCLEIYRCAALVSAKNANNMVRDALNDSQANQDAIDLIQDKVHNLTKSKESAIARAKKNAAGWYAFSLASMSFNIFLCGMMCYQLILRE